MRRFLVGTHLLLKGLRDDLSPAPADQADGSADAQPNITRQRATLAASPERGPARPTDGAFQVAQFEASPEDARRFSTKLKPPVVPPPRPKTRQELLDEADHDEAKARSMNWYGRHLEAGGDAIDDMDIPLKEYGEHQAGLPSGVADAYGAAKTVIGIRLQEEAKRRLERARRAREQAARMPK